MCNAYLFTGPKRSALGVRTLIGVGPKPTTTRTSSLVFGEFDDDRNARQVLGEGLPKEPATTAGLAQ